MLKNTKKKYTIPIQVNKRADRFGGVKHWSYNKDNSLLHTNFASGVYFKSFFVSFHNRKTVFRK